MQDLSDPNGLARSAKFDIIRNIWPDAALTEADFHEEEYYSYLNHIGQELKRVSIENHSPQTRQIVTTLINDCEFLSKKLDQLSGDEVLREVGSTFTDADADAIRRAVKLAVRVFLTIDVSFDVVDLGDTLANTAVVKWLHDVPLHKAVAYHFLPTADISSKIMLNPSFNAAHLATFCGVKISWTGNLAEHLHFNLARRVLTVYEHKVCLLNHARCFKMNRYYKHALSWQILDEAINTLDLLFPYGDPRTRDFLTKQGRLPLYSLGISGRDRQLNLSHYPIFGEKLANLVEIFNEPPSDVKQLMFDRRNMRDWANLWIAG